MQFPEPKLIHKELRCCVIKDLYFRFTRDFQKGMLRLCKKINITKPFGIPFPPRIL